MRDIKKIDNPFPKPILIALWMLVLAIAYKSFSQLEADYDLWFHLFIGNQNLTNQSIGRIDLYSFTAYGLPVVNHEWLADLIMAGAYQMMGASGLIVWRWIMVLAIVLACLRLIICKTQNQLSRIITFLCFIIVIAPGISFRVQLFSYFFLLFLLNLIHNKHQNRTSLLIYLVTLFFVWANIHGAFILGLLIWWIYLMERVLDQYEKPRLSTIALAISPVAATLINPYGMGLWKFIYGELSNPISSRYITEWRHFSFDAREFAFLVVCLLTWFAFLFSGKTKSLAETIVLILASIMGFMAVRHTPLFAVLTVTTMARHFDGAIQKIKNSLPRSEPSPPLVTSFSVFFLLAASIFFLYIGSLQPFKIRTDMDPLPRQSIAFIQKHQLKGNLWTPLHWGAYALFHLYPNIRVSIDGRWAMVYPHKVMQANMDFAYAGTGRRWKKLLTKYNADYALVENDNPALPEMQRDPDWQVLLKEESCMLIGKRDHIQ